MRRPTLGVQVFMAMVAASLGTALIVGSVARRALASAFDRYLAALPTNMMGRPRMGMGRMLLGSAEQTFIGSVDRGVVLGALVAVAVAACAAVLASAHLTRPLRRLRAATQGLTSGDLSRRVAEEGPAEVADLGAAFNEMAGSLEQAELLRRRMVADVAHELRNPLAAARVQTEGMADGVIAADAARLASLDDDLRHLSALVDDLQDLAVAEAGRLRYEKADVDLAALAEYEAARAATLLRPGVALAVEAPSRPACVHADERRLAQVMRNLLSNAARHTEVGSVTVTVEAKGTEVVVRVTDTGGGLAPDEIDHIFERFYRSDSARAVDTGGAGLGLAISQAIVRDHGGDVFARSVPSGGLEVGFWLPAGYSTASAAREESGGGHHARVRSTRR